jgi:hypothetical protein
MLQHFWQRRNTKIVSISTRHFNWLAFIAVIAVVTYHGYSSHILVKMPNGVTFSSRFEPSRR